MSNDNTESISAKLRRWADESESADFAACYPTTLAKNECGFADEFRDYENERDLFRYLADEIDREMDELRELTKPGQPIGEAVREIATGEDKYPWGDSKYPLLKKALDRYFLPRPLFEDGEPVNLGDRYLMDNGSPDTASSFTYTKGYADYVSINGHRRGLCERVKRPKTQVLDADGVPIDAGDTVWHVSGDAQGTVQWFNDPDESSYFIKVAWTNGNEGTYMPDALTHREPDTQERIDRDALKGQYEYWGCTGAECAECPALADGKKPSERYGVLWCSDAIRLDLLRRQRELDKRTGGE